MNRLPNALSGREAAPSVPSMAIGNVQRIAIALLRRDGGTQIRALNPQVASNYAALMGDGVQFPPVCAFFDGMDYWLADGFHRLAAAIQNHEVAIEADVHPGTLSEAVRYACRTNSGFGDWRTANDKRSAVSILLDSPGWAERSDREIARACGVSADLVGKLRRFSPFAQYAARTVHRGGRSFPMNVGAINGGRHLRKYSEQEIAIGARTS